MENIKETIGRNLAELRREKKFTQQALAEKINYSDKAISRWERGETLPDIETLCKICDIFGVTFEYLLQKEQPEKSKNPYVKKSDAASKISISLIAICTVWVLAAVLFVYGSMRGEAQAWKLFIWAIPVTAIVGTVCNRLWGNNAIVRFICVTVLNWTLILSIYIQMLEYNMWMLFLIGIPVQLIIILATTLKQRK